jgi:hypothetical protein
VFITHLSAAYLHIHLQGTFFNGFGSHFIVVIKPVKFGLDGVFVGNAAVVVDR